MATLELHDAVVLAPSDGEVATRSHPAGWARLVNRRRIQVALGVLWILDGLLQLQPFMFSRTFATEVIAPAGVGQPSWVAWPVHQAASAIGSHPVAWNSLFALAQLALGVGLLWRKTVRLAVVGSVLWACGVWLFGEGLGGLAGGSASLLAGAPGAAPLYAVLALAAWPGPRTGTEGRAREVDEGVAPWFPIAWAVIWLDFALLAVLPANRSSASVTGLIHDQQSQVPGWLGSIDHETAQSLHHLGGLVVVLLVLVPLIVGALGLGTIRQRRVAAWAGVTLALLAWVVGQSFGLITSGMATDPSTGPLLVLCSAALLGVRSPTRPTARGVTGPV